MNSSVPPQEPNAKRAKDKLWWSLVFVLIAALTIWTVSAQSKSFSVSDFFAYIQSGNPFWLAAAALSMIGFVVLEGYTVIYICRAFGYRRSLADGVSYAAADIYFSAITPSASGGQPACAYFMSRDGIPSVVSAVTVLANLVMYTLSMVLIGLVCFLLRPNIFWAYGTVSRILILVGCMLQLGLSLFLSLLLWKKDLMHRLCRALLRIPERLHLLRNPERVYARLDSAMETYGQQARLLRQQRQMLPGVLALNLLQRLGRILVTVFTFLAHHEGSRMLDVLVMQVCNFLGANCVPIPGAMGVSDYLMLDSFGSILPIEQATNLVLLSRSLSFYLCILLCGAIALIKYISIRRRAKRG